MPVWDHAGNPAPRRAPDHSRPDEVASNDAGDESAQTRAVLDRPSPSTRDVVLSKNLAKTMVTSSRDAIGLLFEAADQNEDDFRSDNDETMPTPTASRDNLSGATSPYMHFDAQLPPQLSQETLALWNRHRFVVQGWFTALEAISYLQLYDRTTQRGAVWDFADCAPVS